MKFRIRLASIMAPIGFLFFSNQTLLASAFMIHLGPPAIGSGGPNSLGLPPSLPDISLTYVNDADIDFHVSIFGLGVGLRERFKWGGYVGLGGALSLSINGSGIGLYNLWGYELFKTSGGWSSHIEYYAHAGINPNGIITPYAIRIGASKWW